MVGWYALYLWHATEISSTSSPVCIGRTFALPIAVKLRGGIGIKTL
jgi:hypothetical protein